MEKFFKIRERGSTVKTEITAGITTFMAMAYILMVNAGMFSNPFNDGSNPLGVSYGAVYIATALSAVVGTLLIGLLANMPLAQATGMGLNAFFVYTVCINMGFSYANALVFILVDGLTFILLTVTGLRKILFEAIPQVIKTAIPAGIGLFIAFLGLQNVGLVVGDASTLVNLHSFNVLADTFNWPEVMGILIAFTALVAIAVLSVKKVKGAVLYGILGGTVLYYLLGFATIDGFSHGLSLSDPFAAFGEFATQSLGKVFTEGLDFSGYLAQEGNTTASLVLAFITTSLAFCIVDMFDTMATLYGACARGNMLDKEGNVPNMEKAMLSDAVATTAGAICGTSTVTTVVESSAGVAEGGRTGLTALVTAGLFVIATFLSPVAQLIPGCATAAALIYVGVLMMGGIKEVPWDDVTSAVPAFLTVAMMPFTYNISYGIGLGLLSYLLIQICSGDIKKIPVGTWAVCALFVAMFVLTH